MIAREIMAEEKKKERLNYQTENYSKGHWVNERTRSSTLSSLIWLLHFSVFALVILAVGVFFQMQLIAIRQELATLKLNFSSWQEERSRNMRKRSSSESESEVEQGEGMQAVHLQGTHPFQHIDKQGRIGPWSASSTDDIFISLRNKNTEIEISQNGIYYVYAQVYYLASVHDNSFQIMSHNGTGELKNHRSLVTCASQGRDVSCYTGFTASFHSGQRLYLNQVERSRIIHFSNGCTFFGVVLLNKNSLFKVKNDNKHERDGHVPNEKIGIKQKNINNK